jgi:ABC-type polysaccharide/polyol phosphate export permease
MDRLPRSNDLIVKYGHGQSEGRAAWVDFKKSAQKWPIWVTLAWMDVKQRYRRAVLGPFWITISMMVLVFTLGVLYSGIFNQQVYYFLPYLAAGFIVWNLISTTISESTNAFIQAEGLIKHGGIPLLLHVFRAVFRNFIISAHNIVVMLPIYAWQPNLITWTLILVLPGVLLLVLNFIWISLVTGILCARFRDLPPIVGNLLQIIFFISPVMYFPSSVPAKLQFIVNLNPFYYAIDVIRAPLLGQTPTLFAYFFLAFSAVFGLLGAFLLFSSKRRRIAYWI